MIRHNTEVTPRAIITNGPHSVVRQLVSVLCSEPHTGCEANVPAYSAADACHDIMVRGVPKIGRVMLSVVAGCPLPRHCVRVRVADLPQVAGALVVGIPERAPVTSPAR